MRQAMLKGLVLWALVLGGLTVVVVQAKGEKVDVLHKGKVISVSVNALNAHLGHGDCVVGTEGCGDDDDDGGIGGGGASGGAI